MIKAIKVRIYPDDKQKQTINNLLGSVRFVYNNCLSLQSDNYNLSGGTYLNTTALYQHISVIKNQDEFSWLKTTNTKLIQQKLIDLDKAFKNFFKHKAGYPNYKSKVKDIDSCRFPVDAIMGIKGNRINLITSLKDIHFKCSKSDEKLLNDKQNIKLKSITLSKTKTNEYELSILIDDVNYKYKKVIIEPINQSIGLDLGIKTFIVTSHGDEYENIKSITNDKNKKRLKKLNRNLSKKVNKSKNKEKARIKLAKKHEDIKNKKNDMLHKISKKLIDENQVIGIEDLNVKGMMKNHHLSKAIQELSLYEFKRQLVYKADWNNRNLVVVDRWFPSSKKCSCCGYKNQTLKLSERTWTCVGCNAHHNRDLNAAKNIEKEALRLYKLSIEVGTSSTEPMVRKSHKRSAEGQTEKVDLVFMSNKMIPMKQKEDCVNNLSVDNLR